MLVCDLIKDQDTYQAELCGYSVSGDGFVLWSSAISAPFPLFTMESWSEFSPNGTSCGAWSPKDAMPERHCMAEVMTDDPMTVSTSEDLQNCMTLMRRHGFRHLPVCHEGQLVGVVSLRDILLHDLNEKDDEVRMMRAYIHSMPDA